MRAVLLIASLLFFNPLAYAADPSLGRLFFTDAERGALEDARRRAQAPKPVQVERNTGVIKPHAIVRFSGMVKRSDGVSAIWVNGKQYYGKERPEDIGLLPHDGGNAISVKLPESGKRVALRVGQDMDATSGVVVERYSLRETPAPVKAAPADRSATQKRRAATGARKNAASIQVEPSQKDEENYPEPARTTTESP